MEARAREGAVGAEEIITRYLQICGQDKSEYVKIVGRFNSCWGRA